MKKTHAFLLFLFLIWNFAHAQYNNIKADQLNVINQKFLSVPNPLMFGKFYNEQDKYYILEYDALHATIYGFTEDNELGSIHLYYVLKKERNSIVISDAKEPQMSGMNMLNYLGSKITVSLDMHTGLLSFSWFDLESEKEQLICTLKITQINFDAATNILNENFWDKIDPVSTTNATIEYNKEEVLNNHVKELIESLKNDKVPDFINDECLDASTMGYCNVSSHNTISLRTDIIKQLSKSDIEKILKIGDTEKLKKKCKTHFTSELFNSDKSTYDILTEAIR